MKMLRTIGAILAIAVGLTAQPLLAATPAEIEASVQKGVAWLATQQQPDGSWVANNYRIGETGLVLTKLVERAHELGQDPFDPDSFAYAAQVIKGYDYLLSQAGPYSCNKTCLRYECRPSTWGCRNVCVEWEVASLPLAFDNGRNHFGYEHGIAIMAMSVTKETGKVISSANPHVNGKTYQEVVDLAVESAVLGQQADGGWHYTPCTASGDRSDNSPAGYMVLGLRTAESPTFGFNSSVPAATKTNLKNWVDYIQNDTDGSSGYTTPTNYNNHLKTGNLLFQSEFADPGSAWADGVQSRAIGYLQNTWDNTTSTSWFSGWKRNGGAPWYQATYNMMKGFQTADVDELTVGGNTIDWFNGPDQMADRIIANQSANGSWTNDVWGANIVSTAWALLTLEKIAPPPPINVAVHLDNEVCGGGTYTVSVDYTSEVANVDGTLTIKQNGNVVATIGLSDFIGTATWDGGTHASGNDTWTAELSVSPTGGGGTPNETNDSASIVEVASPVVGDIPDQTTPFTPFDLDDYLSGNTDVAWSYERSGSCMDVVVDGDNVVTVTNPGEACEDAETLTFTATASGDFVSCSAEDSVTFTPNQPPVAVCADVEAEANAVCEADANIDGGSWDPDGDDLTITQTPAGPFGLGLTEGVVLDVSDGRESDSCSASVNVIDVTPPTATAPADVTVDNDEGVCGAVVDLGSPTIADNCDVASVENDAPAEFPVGTTTVTWTITDTSGNVTTVTQNVTVVDAEDPVLSSPAGGTAECPADTSVNAWGEATATDNCGAVVTLEEDVLEQCGGTETVTRIWTATDDAGNTVSEEQVIVVEDTTPPSLDSDVADIFPKDAPIEFGVTSSDACGSVELDLSYSCHAVNKKGKEIDKMESCVVSVSNDGSISIEDGGGVGTIITVSATGTDECGNATDEDFVLNVKRPPNQGVGNGAEGGDPGNSNQGDDANSNDENGGTPGDPGKKGGKKG